MVWYANKLYLELKTVNSYRIPIWVNDNMCLVDYRVTEANRWRLYLVGAKSGSTIGGIPLGSCGCGTQNIKIAPLRVCQYLPATKEQ